MTNGANPTAIAAFECTRSGRQRAARSIAPPGFELANICADCSPIARSHALVTAPAIDSQQRAGALNVSAVGPFMDSTSTVATLPLKREATLDQELPTIGAQGAR